jgi:selenocysteine lyase/cysteine desulfurase
MSELLERWRRETPGSTDRIHLNNAGAALMPQEVLDACKAHLDLEARIGGYEAADARAADVSRVYADVGRLIGAANENIAIVPNATAGFIQSISSFDLEPGDVIVTTRSDYTSYQITFLSLAERLGIVVRHAEDLPEGGVDPESVRDLASDRRCRLVHVSWVPTHSGLIQDAAAVGEVCESLDVPYLLDACQAVGQIPIDVTRLKCDYLTATARKFLRGPRGIGFMYASDKALDRGDHRFLWTCGVQRGLNPISTKSRQRRCVMKTGSSPTHWCSGSVQLPHTLSTSELMWPAHALFRWPGAFATEYHRCPARAFSTEAVNSVRL